MKKLVIEFVGRGMKSHFAAKLAGVSENEVAETLEDYDLAVRHIEDDYYENEWPKVEQAIRDMKADIPESERIAMRRDGLLAEVREMKNDPNNPRLPKLIKEVKIFTGRIEGISPEKVLRAREYPISQLVKFTNRVAKCIWHTEKSPSLHLFPDNHVHCFGCSKTGDAIDIYMELNGCSFKEAVDKLS